MSVLKNKKIQISAGIFFVLGIVVAVVIIFAGNDYTTGNSKSAPGLKSQEGFTFFELGVDSELTNNIRDELRAKLGSDAVEKWTTLDLGVNYKGFIQNHFKTLDQLNQRLNFPPGERVEHNIIKLRYRYAQRKKVPFKYVELIFSNYTKKPLLFKVASKKEGAFIVDSIRSKHGEPKTINREREEGRSLYWEKNKSFLIISILKDRYGDPEYHTVIYFVPNIEAMLSKEEQVARQREEAIKQKGKTAF
jgi:hypothetical protein